MARRKNRYAGLDTGTKIATGTAAVVALAGLYFMWFETVSYGSSYVDGKLVEGIGHNRLGLKSGKEIFFGERNRNLAFNTTQNSLSVRLADRSGLAPGTIAGWGDY